MPYYTPDKFNLINRAEQRTRYGQFGTDQYGQATQYHLVQNEQNDQVAFNNFVNNEVDFKTFLYRCQLLLLLLRKLGFICF